MKRRGFKSGITPYLYVLPAIVPMLVFLYWPLIVNFILSVLDWNFISPTRNFIGLKNYTSLFQREAFSMALINTGKYILGLLPWAILIPLAISVLILTVKNKKLRDLYETALFIPTVLSFSVACFVWIWMLTPIGGVIATLLESVGLRPISWLADHRFALWAIVIVSGWRIEDTTSFCSVDLEVSTYRIHRSSHHRRGQQLENLLVHPISINHAHCLLPACDYSHLCIGLRLYAHPYLNPGRTIQCFYQPDLPCIPVCFPVLQHRSGQCHSVDHLPAVCHHHRSRILLRRKKGSLWRLKEQSNTSSS